MTGLTGVAISTTGDPHRLHLLGPCVRGWRSALPEGSPLVVTVDGGHRAVDRVIAEVRDDAVEVALVGQATLLWVGPGIREGRHGVAANKNTGLEWLVDQGAERLFLSDDDTWPLSAKGPSLHAAMADPHSMVCWGRSRWRNGAWAWPRGVLLYVDAAVLEAVGGMDERFGPGGHEHVEWSRRIHQQGLTSTMFPSPEVYAGMGGMGARRFWHAEDLPQPGERMADLRLRRRKLTSVRREEGDWPMIEGVMAERDGKPAYVPFRAHANGRESATLFTQPLGRGAGGEE